MFLKILRPSLNKRQFRYLHQTGHGEFHKPETNGHNEQTDAEYFLRITQRNDLENLRSISLI